MSPSEVTCPGSQSHLSQPRSGDTIHSTQQHLPSAHCVPSTISSMRDPEVCDTASPSQLPGPCPYLHSHSPHPPGSAGLKRCLQPFCSDDEEDTLPSERTGGVGAISGYSDFPQTGCLVRGSQEQLSTLAVS